MMKHLRSVAFIIIALAFLPIASCSKKSAENPFDYPFIHALRIKRQQGKPYSEYKAFYLLTEDFEPRIESPSDIDEVRDILGFATGLSSKYSVPWTHFVDVNALADAFISDDAQLKQKCRDMIADLKQLVASGDDCQMHMHGPVTRELLDFLKSQEKLRVKPKGVQSIQGYRQRKSFFFHSFYAQGYREMVTSLIYGKSMLEKSIYDGKKEVVAFRPGGWDHGSSAQDTFLYFDALSESGLTANSGLVTGEFGSQSWLVGNRPGRNLARVEVGEKSIIEVSPTTGPGGYINPVLPNDLGKIANEAVDEMAVIMSVYHLSGLQRRKTDSNDDSSEPSANMQNQRDMLESHFQTVADLVSKKVLYPITLRQLLAIISEQE